ncbi:acyl-CoA dehydrogenase family protein [Novosphingobium sp. KCTC 2891]|uniref:acyl-CoA dehydrogenase family protein n=1 Tax=Novosphingobium sp. KCTC 2891 TaxID=2989730 RepID=UPI00222382B0|nr:acyl-CoA dehydrogenase family protein [Novosphingobium sp. KCTC 2891]
MNDAQAFPPSLASLMHRVEPLLPRIAARAQEADALRDIPVQTIDELRAAGLFDLYKPRRWGGKELRPEVFLALQNALAEQCPSTAWVFGVLNVQALVVALFSEQAQADVWADGQGALVSSSFAPTGTATPVEGGYRLSGRWTFASGSTHTAWSLLGARIEGLPAAEASRLLLVPRADYAIEDVWHTFGMKGTGSNDIVARDVFVPAHRVHQLDTGVWTVPAADRPGPTLYRLPWLYLFTAGISNLCVGIGRAALKAFIASNKSRVSPLTGQAALDNPAVLQVAARLHAETDAVAAQFERHVALLWDHAERDEPLDSRTVWTLRSQETSALRRIADCVDEMMLHMGARAIRNDSPLVRPWLDLMAARAHIGNDPTNSLTMLGSKLMKV